MLFFAVRNLYHNIYILPNNEIQGPKISASRFVSASQISQVDFNDCNNLQITDMGYQAVA